MKERTGYSPVVDDGLLSRERQMVGFPVFQEPPDFPFSSGESLEYFVLHAPPVEKVTGRSQLGKPGPFC